MADRVTVPQKRRPVLAELRRPLAVSFVVGIGLLLAAALAVTVVSLSTVLVSITLAGFLALGLDPAVQAMQLRGIHRTTATVVVAIGFVILAVLIVTLVMPTAIQQLATIVRAAPDAVAAMTSSEWLLSLDEALGIDLVAAARDGLASLATLGSFVAVSGGLLHAGVSIVSAISSTILVVVITIYFVASLTAIKEALISLVPAYSRSRASSLTEEITGSVGAVVAGGITLSTINAAVVFFLQLAIGSSAPLIIALAAFFITLVPLIGSLIFLVIGTAAALFVSPTAALIFGIAYFAYIQIEAYYVTPRVMGRAVAVPGVLIIIGAMAGATLLGLLGALVAIPIVASILIIIRRVVIPNQDAKTTPPND